MRVRCGRIGWRMLTPSFRRSTQIRMLRLQRECVLLSRHCRLRGRSSLSLRSFTVKTLLANLKKSNRASASAEGYRRSEGCRLRYLNPASQGLPQRSTLSLPFDPCAEPPLPWVKGLASALGVIPPSRPTLLLEPGYCRMSGGALPDRRVSGLVLIAIKVQYIEANG
jgi:hypothetical protein